MSTGTLSFNRAVAEHFKCSVIATIIKDFDYLISFMRDKGENFFKGATWFPISLKKLSEKHTYTSLKSIERRIKKLEDCGWLKSGFFSKNKNNRTKYYTLTKKYYEFIGQSVEIPSSQSDEIHNKDNKLIINTLNHPHQDPSTGNGNGDTGIDKNDDDFFTKIKKKYSSSYDINSLFTAAKKRIPEGVKRYFAYLRTVISNMLQEELEEYSLAKKEKEKEKIKLKQRADQVRSTIEKQQDIYDSIPLNAHTSKDVKNYLNTLRGVVKKMEYDRLKASSNSQMFLSWLRKQQLGSFDDWLQKKYKQTS